MNEEKVIKLKTDRRIFEEIYFNGNQASLLLSPTTKGKTTTTLIIGAILLAALILKNRLGEENLGILYFLSFLFLLCVIFLSVSVNNVVRWKKGVEQYLKSVEASKSYEIRFNNESFEINMDDQKESSLWKDFETADINDDYVSLEGKYNYMFPKKSMSTDDYIMLTAAIRKNFKE
ncbi:hypothetical protein HNP38_001330 [Chryseobacterium defluvii]|uniref:YcxB-like protein n=1 Tax=Chryseobacterium defluvii TaxID=160396 RepID=A0A840KDI9_9FLAO|nr:hypothetical protein [Chryseobacterium defluvii]MBB4806058.1 hypothetical protein [Chryseobacterium defluvii]